MKLSRPFLIIHARCGRVGIVFHAFGSYYGGIDRSGDNFLRHDWRRFAVVVGFVLAFLAFWGVMLASRRRRLQRDADDAELELYLQPPALSTSRAFLRSLYARFRAS